MSTVTFEGYLPIPRFDGIPWDRVVIEEAGVDVDGTPLLPWTSIDTVIFPDPDPDPKAPKTRGFTTTQATLDAGWYRVTFRDAQGNQLPTEPTFHPRGPLMPYSATVQDVARHITARTRDEFGNLTGTFGPTTTPTDTQVALIIDDATRRFQDKFGDVIPLALHDNAARIVALMSAIQVELDFFSDQVNTGRSIYPQLNEQLKDEVATFAAQLKATEENDGVPTTTMPATGPAYTFPDATLDPPGLRRVW